GVEVSGTRRIARNISLNATYNIQVAYPTDIPLVQEQLLQTAVNNQQFIFVPLHKANAELQYANGAGATAYLRWTLYDHNNTYGAPVFSVYDAGANFALPDDRALHVV